MQTVSVPKYQGLQILRILAACLVLITHTTFYAAERLSHNKVYWHRGAAGVDIFFVLSGFVMLYSSKRLFHSPDGWKIFAERRIVRIVPMYWLATTVKLCMMVLAGGLVLHATLSVSKTLLSYFFLPSFNKDGEIQPLLGVGWTLNFEMFFYFLFTLALFLRVNVYRFVGVVLALLACAAYFRKPWWPPAAFYLDSIVLEFYLGMLIGRLCLENRHLSRSLAILTVSAGTVALLLIPDPSFPLPRIVQLGIPAALMVWGVASLEQYLTSVPAFLLFLADGSYVIYLFHPLVAPLAPAMLAKLHLGHPVLAVFVGILLALTTGSIIHQFIEKSTTNWLRQRVRAHHREVAHAA